MMQMNFNFDKNQQLELSLLKNGGSEPVKSSAANVKTSSLSKSNVAKNNLGFSDSNLINSFSKEPQSAGNGLQGEPKLFGADVGIQVQYPKASRVLGESGEVQVGLQKNSLGHIENIFIRRSSGSKNLDEAALQSVKANLNQEKIQSLWPQGKTMILTFIFQLTESSH